MLRIDRSTQPNPSPRRSLSDPKFGRETPGIRATEERTSRRPLPKDDNNNKPKRPPVQSTPCYSPPQIIGPSIGGGAVEFAEGIMAYYYDPFNVQEEEAFLELEKTESFRVVEGLIEGIQSLERIAGIRLSIPLEASSLERLVEALLSRAAERDPIHSGVLLIESLHCSHWGLGDHGVRILRPLLESPLVQIKNLSLPNCGITFQGFLELLQIMADAIQREAKTKHACPPTTQPTTLDLSRNNLRAKCLQPKGLPPSLPPEEVLFLEWLPRCTNLETLILSATGLNESWMASLFHGCSSASRSGISLDADSDSPAWLASRRAPSCGDFSLDTLDVSYNLDSLEDLLGILLKYLPYLRLRSLVLTRGASSSTCIDADHPRVRPCPENSQLPLLDHLIQRLDANPRLQFLGPIGMLPLDRQSSEEARQWYDRCLEQLQEIRCFRLRRNRLNENFLRSLVRSTNNSGSSRPGHGHSPLPTLGLVLDATIGSRSTFSAKASHEKDCPLASLKVSLASLKVSLAYHLIHETSCFWSQNR